MKNTNADNGSKNPSKVIIVPKPPKETKDTASTPSAMKEVAAEFVKDAVIQEKDVVKDIPAKPKVK